MNVRERQLVELVSADGTAIGESTVENAHHAPGRLHRAFSVLLFDDEGRTLLQQRSASKTRFALRWANSCCGHPAPGEDVGVAARRRLVQELGVRDVPLTDRGVYTYRASDVASGRVEHEYDHVLVGRLRHDTALALDPDEVAGTRWVSAEALRATADGDAYAPWLAGVLSVALTSLDI